MKSRQIWSILSLVLLMSVFVMNLVCAIDFNQGISSEDQATFDEILEPVMKVYNLIKYSATIVAVLVLIVAGFNLMTSGSNSAKREQAKNMIMYVVFGLILIWVAPLLVNFIVG